MCHWVISVGTATSVRAERLVSQEQEIFIFFKTPKTDSVPPPPGPIQWEPGVISLWLKRPGREADDPSIYSRDEEQVEVYLYPLSRLHIVHRDFTFLLDAHTVLSLGTYFPASFRPEFISRDSRAHRAVFPLRLHQQSRKFRHRCS